MMMCYVFIDIDAPISHQTPGVDQSSVDTLISFGFPEEVARKALKASVNLFPNAFKQISFNLAMRLFLYSYY